MIVTILIFSYLTHTCTENNIKKRLFMRRKERFGLSENKYKSSHLRSTKKYLKRSTITLITFIITVYIDEAKCSEFVYNHGEAIVHRKHSSENKFKSSHLRKTKKHRNILQLLHDTKSIKHRKHK